MLLPAIHFLLMIIAKYASKAANFNPKSLVRTVKQLLADTSQQGVVAGKGQTVKVKRIVRRPKARAEVAGVATAAAGVGLGAGQEQPIVSPTTSTIMPLCIPVTPAGAPRLMDESGVLAKKKRRKEEEVEENDKDQGGDDGGDG